MKAEKGNNNGLWSIVFPSIVQPFSCSSSNFSFVVYFNQQPKIKLGPLVSLFSREITCAITVAFVFSYQEFRWKQWRKTRMISDTGFSKKTRVHEQYFTCLVSAASIEIGTTLIFIANGHKNVCTIAACFTVYPRDTDLRRNSLSGERFSQEMCFQ